MRLTTLSYSLHEARQTLRQRLTRYLDTDAQMTHPPSGAPTLTDPQVLELLRCLNIEEGLGRDEVRKLYEDARHTQPDADDFESVFARGLLVAVGNRVHAHRAARASQGENASPTLKCLAALVPRLGELRLSVKTVPSDPRVAEAMKTLVNSPGCVPSSPDHAWIAARLWEASAEDVSNDARLDYWIARFKLLSNAWFVPSQAWSRPVLGSFETLALAYLNAEPSIQGWEDERGRVAAASAPRSEALHLDHVPKPPTTLFERQDWVDEHTEHAWLECFWDARSDLALILRLLLWDVANRERAPAPVPVMQDLLQLAEDSPFVLAEITAATRRYPTLIADILLAPATAPLGAKLVGGHIPRRSAYDDNLRDELQPNSALRCFEDATEVIGYHFDRGQLPVEESAALLIWLKERAESTNWQTRLPDFDSRVAARFEREVIRWGEQEAKRLVAALAAQGTPTFGSARFNATLQAASLSALPSVVPASLVVEYITRLDSLEYPPRMTGLGPDEAAVLEQVARADSDDRYTSFLQPMNFRKKAQDLSNLPDEKRFSEKCALEVRLRTHLRLLTRAALGRREDTDELRKAILELISAGARDDPTRGLVSAFSSRHETGRYDSDRSLNVDIAEFIRTLPPEWWQPFVDALVTVTEPLFLADVARLTPSFMAEPLRRRIDALHPDEADFAWTLPAMQARITSLIDVGALEAASRYIKTEKELKTLGPVRGREGFRLQAELRILIARREYAAILKMKAPTHSRQADDQEQLGDTLEYFQAIAELLQGEGSVDAALRYFQAKNQRERSTPMYAVNLFAAMVTKLTQEHAESESATPLRGVDATDVRALLAKGEALIADVRELSDDARKAYVVNRAGLRIALGECSEAADELRGLPATVAQDAAVMNLLASALGGSGRADEAAAVLERAIAIYGPTDELRNRRAALASAGQLVGLREPDEVAELSRAWARIEKLGAGRKAQVWTQSTSSDALHELLVKLVRVASRRVMSLLPFMYGNRCTSPVFREPGAGSKVRG